jgi:hypothetical protein
MISTVADSPRLLDKVDGAERKSFPATKKNPQRICLGVQRKSLPQLRLLKIGRQGVGGYGAARLAY